MRSLRRSAGILLVGLLVGSLLLTPVGAHINNKTKHLGRHAWREVIKKRVYTKRQINRRTYTRAQADNRFYTRAQADDRYFVHERTILVPAEGSSTERGDALRDAIDGITDASFSDPWLVRLEPGSYDLGGETLFIPQFVSLEGAGADFTRISCDCATAINTVAGAGAVLHMDGFSTLRGLAVRHFSDGEHLQGIDLDGGVFTLTDVDVIVGRNSVSAVTEETSGITARGSTEMDGVFVFLLPMPSDTNYGIRANAGASGLFEIRDSRVVVVVTGGDAYGISIEGGRASVRDVNVDVDTIGDNYGLFNTDARVVYHDVTSRVSNGGVNYAFLNEDSPSNDADDAATFDGVRALAIGAGTSYYGITNLNANARIYDSELVAQGVGQATALRNQLTESNAGIPRTVEVEGSRLETRDSQFEDGIENQIGTGEGGRLTVENSTIQTAGSVLTKFGPGEAAYDVFLASSRLAGEDILDAGVECVSVWDEFDDYYETTCPLDPP